MKAGGRGQSQEENRRFIRCFCLFMPEFRGLIAQAVAGTGANFRHTVAPFWIRQMADIRY
jgi:hypothetical protein